MAKKSDSFQNILLSEIQIVERPVPGEKRLFFNPRSLTSMNEAEMLSLRIDIQKEGLQQPPVTRTVRQGKKTIYQLVAGERRIRNIRAIVDQNLPCFDEEAEKPDRFRPAQVVLYKGDFAKVLDHTNDKVKLQFLDTQGLTLTDRHAEAKYSEVYPTTPGAVLYEMVPCKVLKDCDDERALRVAFMENHAHEKLHIRDEIGLLERLVDMGYKQGEIARLLHANETWVSHTLNFKKELPPEAYQSLLDSKMARHVAVDLLKYRAEDRQKLYEDTVVLAEQEAARKIAQAETLLDQHEAEEDITESLLIKAEQSGDDVAASKLEKKAKVIRAKRDKIKAKKDDLVQKKGHIKQSHVQKAAAQGGITTKKAKILPKDEISTYYIAGLEEYLDGNHIDPICDEKITTDMIGLIQATASGILQGQRDPLKLLRTFMVEQGSWTVKNPLGAEEEDDLDDDIATLERSKSSKRHGDDDFEDEDDEDQEAEELEAFGIHEMGDEDDLDDQAPDESVGDDLDDDFEEEEEEEDDFEDEEEEEEDDFDED